MLSEPAVSAPRRIDVAPERFPGWIASFADRHGAVSVRSGAPGAGVGAERGGPSAAGPAAGPGAAG
ncbi:MAG: hypothetical protein ACRDND_15975, partial [Streptosporangiaceae bacterium]